MSAATANKPASSGTPRREAASKAAASSPAAATRTPAKSSTATANGAGGVARTRSVRSGTHGAAPVSARAAAKRPAAASNLSSASPADTTDDDARDEQAAYVQELKDRLHKAESEAGERQKLVEVLNARLDESLAEQAKLEERAHEEEEKVESLENVKRELTRQHRELESIYEAEHTQAMKEKEELLAREEELQNTIQRLKETMATKNVPVSEDEEPHGSSRPSSFRNNASRSNSSQNLENFAPPSSIQRSNSRNNSKLINQKDKIIEDLRLELAEYQVKVLEVENAGGGRLRELEKQLLETRMTNARLMEDNESFQLLLGEKTLNGDLSRGDFLRESAQAEERPASPNGPSTSLADELQSAADVEVVRRLEGEVNSMRAENKALTLYINKIIGRLLTHQGFESVLGTDLDAESSGMPDKNKELPPPPPQETEQPQGFLQRAKSVAMGGSRNKPRPLSMMGPPPQPIANATHQSAHEDPATAPSIPLARTTSGRQASGSYTHRRSASEIGAASVVNNMYRAPGATSPNPTSPGIVSPRNSFFGLPVAGVNGVSNPTSRAPSGQGPIPEDKEVDSSTISSSASHVDTPSPPRRLERSETSSGPMTGKGMRPLRLVQNEEEAMKARKAANRASWFGGLFGQAPPQQQQQGENNGQ